MKWCKQEKKSVKNGRLKNKMLLPETDNLTQAIPIIAPALTLIGIVVGSVLTYFLTRPKTDAETRKLAAETHELTHKTDAAIEERLNLWIKRCNELAEESYKLENEYDETKRRCENITADLKNLISDWEELIEDCPAVAVCEKTPRVRQLISRMKIRHKLNDSEKL